jgi:hypothetical protein
MFFGSVFAAAAAPLPASIPAVALYASGLFIADLSLTEPLLTELSLAVLPSADRGPAFFLGALFFLSIICPPKSLP